MKKNLALVACIGLVPVLGLAAPKEARGSGFSFGFGSGRYCSPYSYYSVYPGFYSPVFLSPGYAYSAYYPVTPLGIRHYSPNRYRLYRGYIPGYRYHYRGYSPYSSRRYYRGPRHGW